MRKVMDHGWVLVFLTTLALACHDTSSSCHERRNCPPTGGAGGEGGRGSAPAGGASSVGGAHNGGRDSGAPPAGGGASVAGTASSAAAGAGGAAGAGAAPAAGAGAGAGAAAAGAGAGAGAGWQGASGSDSGGFAGSAGSTRGSGVSPLPCGAACSGDTPLCDEATDRCVECLATGDCDAPSVCDPAAHRCVGCVAQSDCDPALPVCDPAAQLCVECLTSTDCTDSALPVCDEASRTCVECLQHTDCTDDKPFCDAQACVACLASSDCTDPAAPVCTQSHLCAPCQTSDDCSRFDGLAVCDAGQCVQCATDSDCPDPSAAACVDNVCSPCTAPEHCGHLDGLAVCDTGQCVECTGAHAAACHSDPEAPRVCDSISRTCSEHAPESAGLCQACVSDAQCTQGQLCVQQLFQDQSVGFFCFWQLGGGNGAPDNCLSEEAKPYADYVAGALSIDGVEADVCGLRVSTCPARQQFSAKDCADTTSGEPEPDSSQCGLVAPNDAVCAEAPGASGLPPVFLCTMRCMSDYDCPSGSLCNTNTTTPYCEL